MICPAAAYSPAVHGNVPLSSVLGQEAPCQGADSCVYDSPACPSVSSDPAAVVVGDGEVVGDGAVVGAEAAGEGGGAAVVWSATGVDGEPLRDVAMITIAATATAVPAVRPMITRLRRRRCASM